MFAKTPQKFTYLNIESKNMLCQIFRYSINFARDKFMDRSYVGFFVIDGFLFSQ